MKTLVLGDAHGQFRLLNKLIHKRLPDRGLEYDNVLLLGDVGIGFNSKEELPPFMSEKHIYFIRGNHDNPDKVKNLPGFWKSGNWNYVPDGTIKDGVLYVGGAWSIDWKWRTPGLDWWFNEELNDEEQDKIFQAVTDYDDEIHTVISHDAPMSLYPQLGVHNAQPSKTTWFLEELRQNYLIGPKRPSNWYFGHHHKKFSTTLGGVLYRCIDVIDRMDYELIDI